MRLAQVHGRATTTVRHRSFAGQKLLVCQMLDTAGWPSGDPVLAIDQHGAGAGDVVMISSDGLGCRAIVRDETSPIRWFTLGLVDPRDALAG
jgi:ethanolamine utilization protein EutN